MPKGDKTRQSKTKDKPYSRPTQVNGPTEGDNDTEEPSVCPVCEEIVKEPSDDGKDPGDEALFCEGKCEAWYHQKCVGLCKCAYSRASESLLFVLSSTPLISDLKLQISTLTSKVNQPPKTSTNQSSASPPLSSSPADDIATTSSSGAKVPPAIPSAPVAIAKNDSIRKFNIVLFGVDECPKGTRNIDREKSDLNNITDILTGLDNSVQPQRYYQTWKV